MGRVQATTPALSVVICHHAGVLIDRCLQSVLISQGLEFDVHVVTSCAPKEYDWLQQRYGRTDGVSLWYEQGGPAHKRNFGMTKTQAPYVVFLDDDLEVSPYALYELWMNIQDRPKVGMGFAKIMNMEQRKEFDDAGSWLTWTGFLWARAGNHQRDEGQYNTPTPVLASKSATCIVRRAAFYDAGGFDPDYYILGEETDLSWRMWLHGWECWYFPSVRTWHAFGCESIKPRADFYTIERTMTYGCRNYLSLLWTNLGTARLLCIAPVHVCAWLVSVTGFSLRGDWKRGRAILQGMREFLQRLPCLQRKRHRVQSTRVVSDRQLFRSIYASPGFPYYVNRMRRYLTTQLHG